MNMEILKHQFGKVERLRYLVDNEWRESKTTKYMPVMDPSTGKQIAEAPCCTQEEVDSAVEAAARAFPAWRDTPIPTRIQLMFRFKQLLDAHLDELTELLEKLLLGGDVDCGRHGVRRQQIAEIIHVHLCPAAADPSRRTGAYGKSVIAAGKVWCPIVTKRSGVNRRRSSAGGR